ncbi:hypothetical protein PHYBOEH_001946 [Phytophthora boehmeriae]|uniref:B box-type domain-containing protein n=1 Tax=Phytophthora boehmeriae TaxID=109152 RepID=A0A8T1WRI1_9STRA|nr:hypothetical protein PHYBOEH_001946 [Phytophthora boehmeriae]
MQTLEVQEDPSFASFSEPSELRRLRCDNCREALADVECQRCVQRFCASCELLIHHRLEALALKHEESKGDGRPHQEFLKSINICQVCGQSGMDFLCVDCKSYQCERCCSDKHLQQQPDSGHFYFCIEGSSPSMLRFASWNTMFVEMVKICKGVLQDKAATETSGAKPSAYKETSAVSEDSKAIHIKQELGSMSTSATTTALRNLSINGTPSMKGPQPLAQASQAKRSARATTTSVVDLTLDDESDSSSASTRAPSQPAAQPRIKEEPRVETENAWLNAATTAAEQPAFDVEEMMEKAMGDEEDTVLRSMIGEYNDFSASLFEMDQEIAKIRAKTKELSSALPINMDEVNRSRQAGRKLRADKAEAERSRNEVVAKIVMYLKPDPEELKIFLDTCSADVPYAQVASHRRCATLEASIRSHLEHIQKIQRDMDDLINMKKDAFAEVTRLGEDIASREQEVRELDKTRSSEFLSLCQYSNLIQDAVRRMSSS